MKELKISLLSFFLLIATNIGFGQVFYPGGDTCETAVAIPAGIYETADDAEINTYWYGFIAPCDGTITVSDAGPNEATKRIYSGVCGSLTLETEGTWADPSVSYDMEIGEIAYIEINDSWDYVAQYQIEYSFCEDYEVDSALLDIQGFVYLDLNDNGVKDLLEEGLYFNPMISEPAGLMAVSGWDGHYFSPVNDYLPDGTYEITTHVPDGWHISSDSLFYTIVIDDDFEQRDSMDFGLHPDSSYFDVELDIIRTWPRCNDTINYSMNVRNIGTNVIDSGLVHLTLDDSVYYVSASVEPDSIVGKDLYWSHESIFPFENELITIQMGTPDGVEDTIMNIAESITYADGEIVLTLLDDGTQVITCAYDPNDKTPTPMGDGPMGNIAPTTETIDYLIRFQNTGTDTAINVVITDQLDENLEWYSITLTAWSHDMTYELTPEGEVSFIFDNIMLPDTNVDMAGSMGFVKYRINLKEDLPLGTSIYNTANIYFDMNPAIVTNTTVNTLYLDDVSAKEWTMENGLKVYPNPFNESTRVLFGQDLKDYTVRIVNVLGNEVYSNDNLSGNTMDIDASDFNAGIYVLMLVNKADNALISTTKLIVQ